MAVYSDINTYIAKLTAITTSALQLSQFFSDAAGLQSFNPPLTEVPLPGTAILKNPISTSDQGTPPTSPVLFNTSGEIPPSPIDISGLGDTDFSFPGIPPEFIKSTLAYSEGYAPSDSTTLALLNDLKTSLNSLVSGTGMELVEIDIWERGIERNLQALYDAEDQTIAKNSMSGWSMPNDIIDRELETLNRNYDNTRITLNDEITPQMIDLYQKNYQLAVEAGLNGEAMMVAYFNRYASRALQAARITQEVNIEEVTARITGYNAYLKANEAQIRGLADAEKSMVTSYGDMLEAKTAEMGNKAESLVSLVSSWKTLIGAFKTYISLSRNKGRTEMSWRDINFRSNLMTLEAGLHDRIAELHTTNAVIGNRQSSKVQIAQTHVHNVASILSQIQVMLNQALREEQAEET